MTTFERLFGINESKVKKTCVILPLLSKNLLKFLNIENLYRGKLYASGENNSFTIIQTGIGAPLLGDSMLYLKDTACKNVVLFGSCGLVSKKQALDIGGIVAPSKCLAFESFTSMLLKDKMPSSIFSPDKDLFKDFIATYKNSSIKEVTCATLGSLKLETDYIGLFEKENIDVLDMECSAFFSSAKSIGLKAIALFYVTDILIEKPFYTPLSAKDSLSLNSSIEHGVDLICRFIENKLS